MNPCFAIIESNTLCRATLQNMLWNIYNNVEVHAYSSVEEFIRDSNRHFIHFFVNDAILFSSMDEFDTLKEQTTVLTDGVNRHFEAAGFHILDLTRPAYEIENRLLDLQCIGAPHQGSSQPKLKRIRYNLSEREKDVLILMIKGLINKEIAEELKISLTTVIFHRNNICLKLGTRSIGKLTIFAVLSGLIDINEV